jgi:hypothetical protein
MFVFIGQFRIGIGEGIGSRERTVVILRRRYLLIGIEQSHSRDKLPGDPCMQRSPLDLLLHEIASAGYFGECLLSFDEVSGDKSQMNLVVQFAVCGGLLGGNAVLEIQSSVSI